MFVPDYFTEDALNVYGLGFLYGCKLEGFSDVVLTAGEGMVKELGEFGRASKGLGLLFKVLERRRIKGGGYRTELYYFSYEKKFIDIISRLPQFKKMSGREIAEVLLRNFVNSEDYAFYRVDPKGKLIIPMSVIDGEREENPLLPEVWTRVLYNFWKERSVYIAAKYLGDVPDFEFLLKMDWSGYFVFIFDYNDQQPLIKLRKGTVYKYRVDWAEMEKEYEQDKEYGALCIYFFPDREEDIDIQGLFLTLGFSHIKINRKVEDYLAGEWLRRRDADFLFLLRYSILRDYMLISFSKTKMPEVSLVRGLNRFKEYVTYNSFEEADNPHVVIVAPSGAGKSFYAQNEVSLFLNLDVGKLYKGEEDKYFDKERRVRYFDKGFSAELFFRLMKERGYDVEFFEPDLEKFVYNVCEFEDEVDLDLSVKLLNSILESLRVEPLSGEMVLLYMNVLREIKSDPKYWYYANQEFSLIKHLKKKQDSSLRVDGVYNAVLDWARKKGIELRNLLDVKLIDIAKSDPGYFSFMMYPTIHDVIRFLQNMRTEEKRELVDKLIDKLMIIANERMFSFYTQVKITGSRIFYMDIENLESNPFFVPLMIVIIKRLFKEDKYKKSERVYAKFFFDEAHNYFRVKQFEEVLNVLIREARRFRVQIQLATQSISDIPVSLLQTAGTKIFLLPTDENERNVIFSQIKEYLKVSEEEVSAVSDVIFKKLEKYNAGFWTASGIFTLSLPVDEYKKMVFDSYRKVLELPDGKALKKSSLKE